MVPAHLYMLHYLRITFELWAAIFCIVAALCVYVTRRFSKDVAISVIAVLLTDAMINICEFIVFFSMGPDGGIVSEPVVRTSLFLLCLGCILFVAAVYNHITVIIETRVGNRIKWPDGFVYGICVLSAILLVASRFLGFYYMVDSSGRITVYDSYSYFELVLEFSVFFMIYMTIKYREYLQKLELAAFLILEILPIVAIVFKFFVPGISLYSIADTVSMIFLVVMYELRFATDMVRRERVIADERIRLYNRQIQPHFIYNCLTAIRSYLPLNRQADKT